MSERKKLIAKVKNFITLPVDINEMSDKELAAWSEFIDFMERQC
jgi:hypothetical protein